jgi:hypothetical protein
VWRVETLLILRVTIRLRKRLIKLSSLGLNVRRESKNKSSILDRGKKKVVYYESIKRELKIRCICECRCDERLQSTKTKEFTCLTYNGLVVELEHLKIETRLINEKFAVVVQYQSHACRLLLQAASEVPNEKLS